MSAGKASISVFALAMLMTGAVDGIRNLPSIAIFGQQLVFFFLAASVFFLLPIGMVSAELCARFKEDSGIYIWAKQAFGSGAGALAIWLQWINTVVWFPTCLTALTGTAAYLVNPDLAQDPTFLVVASLSVFWVMTWLNLKGIQRATRMAAFATSLGMLLPMVLIIGLSYLWVILGKPQAIHLTKAAVLPPLNHVGSWTSLTAIVTSFLGMELAAVHVKKVKNAQQVFPKALFLSIVIILLTMGLGSLGMALVVPNQEIALVTGTIQAFYTLFAGFHLPWLAIVIGVLILLGSLGAMVNWLISPANGLAQAAQDGYLPKVLAKENAHGMPVAVLIMQAFMVSVASLVYFLMPSVNGSYWLLLDLSTELYVAMYAIMFLVAIKHFWHVKKTLVIPGGKPIAILLSVLGFLACVVTLVVGFLPPSDIDVGSAWHFVAMFGGGLLLMMSPVVWLIHYQRKGIQAQAAEAA